MKQTVLEQKLPERAESLANLKLNHIKLELLD